MVRLFQVLQKTLKKQAFASFLRQNKIFHADFKLKTFKKVAKEHYTKYISKNYKTIKMSLLNEFLNLVCATFQLEYWRGTGSEIFPINLIQLWYPF